MDSGAWWSARLSGLAIEAGFSAAYVSAYVGLVGPYLRMQLSQALRYRPKASRNDRDDLDSSTALWNNSDWSELYQSYGVSVTLGVMDSIVDSVIREAAFYWAGLPWDDTKNAQVVNVDALVVDAVTSLATGFLTAPLRVLETRLVLRDKHSAYEDSYGTYAGIYDAIVNEEGVASFLSSCDLDVFNSFFQTFTTRYNGHLAHFAFGVEPGSMDSYVAEMAIMAVETAVMYPIVPIKTRLAIQNPLLSHDLEAIVRVPPRRYAGIIDAARTMVNEESYLALYGGFEYEAGLSGVLAAFTCLSYGVMKLAMQ